MVQIIVLGGWWFWQIATGQPSDWLIEVNAHRAKGCWCGSTYFPAAPAVRWNTKLAQVASGHSLDMATKKYFQHTSPSGETVVERLNKVQVSWEVTSENLFQAKGFIPSPAEVIQAWLQSPRHCRNILDPRVTDMGVGENRGRFTQVFIRPKKGN